MASQVVLVVKNLPANAGDIKDVSSILGLGRSPGGGHGNPLRYSCQENSMDRGAWWAMVLRVTKSQTGLKLLRMHGCIHYLHIFYTYWLCISFYIQSLSLSITCLDMLIWHLGIWKTTSPGSLLSELPLESDHGGSDKWQGGGRGKRRLFYRSQNPVSFCCSSTNPASQDCSDHLSGLRSIHAVPVSLGDCVPASQQFYMVSKH